MADKRKKRASMAATASHYEPSREEFHVVNIGGDTPRRRSASAGRSESWMAKVTTAMSHRLFAGRRLSGSRSTQVMPMFITATEQNANDTNEANVMDQPLPSRDHSLSLRMVSSEATLPRGILPLETSAQRTAVCDIEADVPVGDEMRRPTIVTPQCRVNTIQVRAPQRQKEKVRPQVGMSDWDDDEARITPVDPAYSTKRLGRGRTDDEPAVTSTTPILKDFFNRSATTAHQEREQQRESRRDSHYKNSKKRHERVRAQCQLDEQNQADQLQREKIERLRKLNLQRRIQMRHEAATLKKSLSTAKTSPFETERERWEQDFQTEIDALEKAYRRACSKKHGETERPITVAGLAVPEALRQIQRDAVGNTRRVQTAAPAGWSASIDGFGMSELSMMPIEDSKEVYAVFGADAEVVQSASNPLTTVEVLLAEREEMAKRIAQLEREVAAGKLCVVVEAPNTIGSEDGFFI